MTNLVNPHLQICGISEADHAALYDELIHPFVDAYGRFGSIQGVADATIQYVVFKHPEERASLILLPGWSESYVKYYETAFDFWQRGISVYLMDHRAQGQSTRIADNPMATWVPTFRHYTEDLKIFWDTVVKPDAPEFLFLSGHSMGGTIALWGALDRQSELTGLILMSPMIAIQSVLPNRILYPFAKMMSFFGKGRDFIFGHGRSPLDLQFEGSWTTHSRARWDRERHIMQTRPELQCAGASFDWAAESFKSGWSLMKRAPELHLPTLLLQSGDESRVSSRAQDEFAKIAPDVTKITIPGAMHELFNEADCYRDLAFAEIESYISQRLAVQNAVRE